MDQLAGCLRGVARQQNHIIGFSRRSPPPLENARIAVSYYSRVASTGLCNASCFEHGSACWCLRGVARQQNHIIGSKRPHASTCPTPKHVASTGLCNTIVSNKDNKRLDPPRRKLASSGSRHNESLARLGDKKCFDPESARFHDALRGARGGSTASSGP